LTQQQGDADLDKATTVARGNRQAHSWYAWMFAIDKRVNGTGPTNLQCVDRSARVLASGGCCYRRATMRASLSPKRRQPQSSTTGFLADIWRNRSV